MKSSGQSEAVPLFPSLKNCYLSGCDLKLPGESQNHLRSSEKPELDGWPGQSRHPIYTGFAWSW